jgi:hypothetical protein
MIKIHAPRLLICNLKHKLIISKRRVSTSVPLHLIEKSTTLSLSNPCLLFSLGHFEFKTLLMLSSAFILRPNLRDQAIQSAVRASQYKQFFFLGPRKFCILRIFKPKFKLLGSYEFRQSLLSRSFC